MIDNPINIDSLAQPIKSMNQQSQHFFIKWMADPDSTEGQKAFELYIHFEQQILEYQKENAQD